jgi:hypothetical protein
MSVPCVRFLDAVVLFGACYPFLRGSASREPIRHVGAVKVSPHVLG